MASGPADAEPRPFQDGSYAVGLGITAPKIIQTAPALYPAELLPDGARAVCLLAMTIGEDGVPFNVHILRSGGASFDAAAIEAVKQSKFEAGSLNGRAVPVRALVRVVFSADQTPAIPTVVQQKYRNADGSVVDTPPVRLYQPGLDFSEEARRKKINGNVRISLTVSEDGLPTDVKVEKSLGYGLDEKAVECVKRYRFRPAQRGGKPVPYHMQIEMSFRLY